MGVPVLAGDGILFTEACRHGGIPNRSDKTRYTLHVGFGLHFLKSQNISTMDEEVHVTDPLLARLTEDQRQQAGDQPEGYACSTAVRHG